MNLFFQICVIVYKHSMLIVPDIRVLAFLSKFSDDKVSLYEWK